METAKKGWHDNMIFALIVGYFYKQLKRIPRMVDKKKPDRYEIIGSIVAAIGALVIFYAPR